MEAQDLQLKIRVVEQMSPDSSAMYLGNSEIIYNLSQIFPSRIAGPMDIEYAS